MSFKDKKYTVVKSAISKELASFVYDYFCMKRKVTRFLFDEKYLSPFRDEFGTWSDQQIPNTYSHYGDIAMETLLQNLLPVMEENTNLKLIPTYSYARIYKKGDILHRHKDRSSCEISTTLNLGGDPWPIYLDPTGKEGMDGIKVELSPGDMLVYKGCELEHWRESFTGKNCVQVFLHYNDTKNKQAIQNKLDNRPYIGLPSWFKNFKLTSAKN